ncbi:unnamed protein product [Didymodactylos carnosus]|uniref:C2H2-type domain-containing protein n=1 Tax=Didymodactylos carnosus TaxID=1234261 RepID=A0A814FXW1_9BILA|nr:unnamed protein product [Didymodactylos carnosus]CAF1250595.1 unnamed protein product [Didymodactylos carnosus]CAF3761225.1 unnamed protein product [Didymodactylos carnosus]CAF4058026.1 unnamed protein product [Didymodactylos carnosus]
MSLDNISDDSQSQVISNEKDEAVQSESSHNIDSELSEPGVKNEPEKTDVIKADPNCLSWYYPPYCELCNVRFTGQSNSQIHFDSFQKHRNRLQVYTKYMKQEEEALTASVNAKEEQQNIENQAAAAPVRPFIVCNICWKELNSIKMLDIHKESPAHKTEEKNRKIVQKLKEEYTILKQNESKEIESNNGDI